MQENEFEKRVQKKMEEFALFPNEEVWKQVQAKIRRKKGRRLIFYWVMAGLLLTGGAGTFYFINSRNSAELKKVSSDKNAGSNLQTSKPVITSGGKISAEEKNIAKGKRKVPAEMLQLSVENRKTKVSGYQKTYSSKATAKKDIEGAKPTQKELIQSKSENEILKAEGSIVSGGLKKAPISKMEERAKSLPHKHLLLKTEQKFVTDTLQKSLLSAKDKTGMIDTLLSPKNNSSVKKSSKNISKKWQFGITIYGGVSDNVEGIGRVSAKSFIAADQNSSFYALTAASVNNVPFVWQLQYKGGLSFGAGAYLKKGLAKKLDATVGVGYHYVSARSLVGNKVNSTLNIYDSVLQRSTIVNVYYGTGRTTSFYNRYHLFQLPLNLQLQLNKNIDRPLVFSLGLSPSVLITTNALYVNSNARAYYREKEQFNKFMLFGQSELLYTLSNKPKYQFNIGPALQYDFNSFSKTATNTRQHLIFTGLKTNITFK